jgi:hypothetical protein
LTRLTIIEKFLMHFGNAIDHAGNADRIVRPAPWLAVKRNAAGNRAGILSAN